ncbi:MAG: hypothetical protein AAF944_26000 [Bacteroidota bacterium]
MIGYIIFCIIAVSIVIALLLAWLYYQKARDRERMYLLERGETLEEIMAIQKKNSFNFVFPWLTIGVVSLGLSVAFLLIAFFVFHFEQDIELFKGLLITFILGTCLSTSFMINHFIRKKSKDKHG